jgi:acyl-CoA reductase-like NAD-dependent aldehyde dehydrogenase
MTTRMFTGGGRTDSGGLPTSVTYDPATGKVLEQVLEATAEDVDAAVRAANRAYWDHVAEVFGRRCSANWTASEVARVMAAARRAWHESAR